MGLRADPRAEPQGASGMQGYVVSALVLALGLLGGCALRPSLHMVVLDYDETVSRAQAEMMLLNIARARHGRPLHFTTVSGVAATFDWQRSVGLGGELAEDGGISILTPSLGASTSENPTISIVPIQGEEFTRRLLKPLDDSVLAFFYHQDVAPRLLLEMIAQAVILEGPEGRKTHEPEAPDASEAAAFVAFAARIERLHRARRLDVGPLIFEETWVLGESKAPSATDLADLIDRGYTVRDGSGTTRLSRRVVGRHAITDYDPATLSDAERAALQRRAQEYPAYCVLLDLRAPGPGEAPLRGWVKLRSLSGLIGAVASGLREEEGAAPATGLQVRESPVALEDSLFSVEYEGLHYALPRDAAGENAMAFRVLYHLYHLYQMAVAELPSNAVPPVTIAK